MSTILTNEEFDYSFDAETCSKCEGKCCIGESGYIWITTAEIKRLSMHLGITMEELQSNYLTKIRYKYTINEKLLGVNNYACIFFDTEKKQCSVYEARPTQCRTFPFWDYFKTHRAELFEECPAIVD